MEYITDAPPPTIDTTAVELHSPSKAQIEHILEQAAQYERSFLTEKDPLPELIRRSMGWMAMNHK